MRVLDIAQRRNVNPRFAGDTVLHSWEVLGKLLQAEEVQEIVCDIGMCVFFCQSCLVLYQSFYLQAGCAQERYLQLSHYHSQRQNFAYSSEDVAC